MGIRTSYFLVLHFLKVRLLLLKKKKERKKKDTDQKKKKNPKGLTEHGKFPLRCV